MNYEQKYKEALENARWKIEHVDCGDENCFNIDDIKDLFSELHESEDDRIRKWLINLLSKMQYHHCDDEMKMGNKALTWLEKQGEQKPAWGEEDIATISRVISIVKWAAYSDHSHPILNDEGATELVGWLKSLKPNHWKPSEEQMKGM